MLGEVFFRMRKLSMLVQDAFFAMPKVGEHPSPLDFLPRVFQPRFELENFDTALQAIFYDSPRSNVVNFHLVFKDEAIPYSRTLDEVYRELRMRKLGRTTDVESFSLRIREAAGIEIPFIRLPLSYKLTPFYSGSLHYAAAGVPWITGQIYSSSFNHLLEQFGRYLSPVVRLFGGYMDVKPREVIQGTREEAKKFEP